MPIKYVFQQSKIPPYNSAFGRKLAKALWDFKMYCHDGRRERDLYVKECDQAYLCQRFVPDTGAIQLLEDGEFGESDLHDIAALMSIRLALALMPRNDQWLTASSREDEADTIVQSIQDLQMSLHRDAKSRRAIQRFIKQDFVRGSSYLWYDWEDEYIYRRMTQPEHAVAIKEYLKAEGLPEKDARKFAIGKHRELRRTGPVAHVLDYYDVWVQPDIDITQHRKPATIIQKFRAMDELLAMQDDFGNDFYDHKALAEIESYHLEEIWSNDFFLGLRRGSMRLFGSPPVRMTSRIKLVPTYVMYMPYFELDGYKFWDTYFHLALSAKGDKATIIKIEENPDDLGLNHLLMDHWEDWFTPTPYGLSGMQFQLSKYHQKNFLQLLTVTAMAHSVFPPNLVLQSAFRNDEEINFGAGATISVDEAPNGLDQVIHPVTTPGQGALQGENFLRFLADELKAATGVDGLATDNGARTLTKPKTATEINADTTAGSFLLDNQAENLSDVINEYVQGVFEMSKYRLQSNSDGLVEYEKYEADKVRQGFVQLQDLQAKRSIQITGVKGQLNRQQDIQNLTNFFQILGQIQDPAMTPIRVWCAEKLAKETNVRLPKQFLMDPNQLVAQVPAVQQAATQNMLQNPQALAQVVMTIMQNPQLMNTVRQIVEGQGGNQANQQ